MLLMYISKNTNISKKVSNADVHQQDHISNLNDPEIRLTSKLRPDDMQTVTVLNVINRRLGCHRLYIANFLIIRDVPY